jgi:ABC-type molybdenum transport system ATPase subunit/photorepair protein PhrA
VIERIYIDNYKTLVNFEWKPGKLALLLGDNGSGKSSVVDALWAVRALATDRGAAVKHWFPWGSRTRWDKRLDVTLELDVRVEDKVFTYKLTIAHEKDEPNKSRVKHEMLQVAERTLMKFSDGELQLFKDSGQKGPVVTSDWFRSGLGGISPGKENKDLTLFKQCLSDLWVLRPDPRAMSGRTDEEPDFLNPDLSNFASWLPQWMAQDFNGAMASTIALKEAIDGLSALQVARGAPKLEALFSTEDGAKYAVDFAELSDGQRQLCALYFLRYAVLQPGRTVIFDEPDNYVALREIQPWLNEVVDLALSPDGPQVWFISHHPEVLNQLAPESGTRFFRERGPTRIEPFKGAEGLNAAEAVARGWVER